MPHAVTNEGKTLMALCAVEEVDPDMPVRVTTDAMDYAVFTVDGDYFVTADLCTHGPGSLAEGYIEGCEVECPFHQGKFDFRTGVPTAPPCVDPLRIWTVQLIDGQVCIDPAEQRGG
jgi:nitrite reductase/ring-hydroxylating ferredoxin subunit